MRLEPGEVFVSRMDLNVERGVLDEPYKPVVRLATPIDDAAGQRRGIVVLNAHGGHFLRAFEPNTDEDRHSAHDRRFRGLLASAPAGGRMGLRARARKELPAHLPRGLGAAADAPTGSGSRAGEGFFYFDAVTLRPAASSDDAEGRELRRFWMFISLVPRRLLDDIAVQVCNTPARDRDAVVLRASGDRLGAGGRPSETQARRRSPAKPRRSPERHDASRARRDRRHGRRTGTTLEFNPSAQRIFGYTREEVRGRPVADLIIPPAHREAHRLGLEHYLATGEGRIIDKHIDELTAIRKGGEEFPVELTVCPVMVAGKQLFCGFLRDLSEKGRSEAAAGPQDASI